MISLLCPTRGRPANVKRFVESALSTARNPNRVEIVFYVDTDDDPATLDAVDAVESIAVIGERIVLSECWNRCAAAATGEILGHMGDDIVFRSDGWDILIADAFKQHGPICFVHGRDGIQDARLGTHGFVHRKWIETVGYLCPPYFSSDFNDTWLTEVADLIDRRIFLPELLTEHHHYTVGKAPYDATHREREERGKTDDVSALYARLEGQRRDDAHKLRAALP